MFCLTYSGDKKAEEGVKESNGCIVKEETDPPKSDDKQENGLSDSMEEKEPDGGTDSQSKGAETDYSLPLEQALSSPSWKEEEQDHTTLTCTSSINSSELGCEQPEQEPDQPTSPASSLTKVQVKDEPGDVEVPTSFPQSPSLSPDQLSLVVTYPLELLKNIKNEKDADPGVESFLAKGGSPLYGEKCEK